MRDVFKVELRRGFYSKEFIASLILGGGLALWHFIEYMPLGKMLLSHSETNIFKSPSILFGIWMGGTPSSVQSYYYFIIIPLLAALPYGASMYQDLKSKYVNTIYIRMEKSNYLFIKWCVLFLTGGSAAVFPAIFNLFLYMNVFPMSPIQIGDSMFPILDTGIFSQLFVEHPLLFNLFYFVLIFIIGGLYATFCLSIAFIAEYEFIVLFSPFIMNFFLITVLSIFNFEAFGPTNFIKPYSEGLDIGVTFLKSSIVALIMILFSFYPVMSAYRKKKG